MSHLIPGQVTVRGSRRAWLAPAPARRRPDCSPEFAVASPSTPLPIPPETATVSDGRAAAFAERCLNGPAGTDFAGQCATEQVGKGKNDIADSCPYPLVLHQLTIGSS